MRFWALVAALILVFGLVFVTEPALASIGVGMGTGQQAVQGQGAEASQQAGGTAGLQPVSPEQLAGKLTRLVDEGVAAASPVLDSTAKLVLAAAGMLLLFFIVSGRVVSRAIGTVIAVVFGLLLWYAAPYIVALVKWFTIWVQS